MAFLVGGVRPLSSMRAIALALITVGAAGCSAESTRFGEIPYGSRGGQGEVTGSIPSGQGAPVGHVETRPLPGTPQPPPPQSPARATSAAAPVVAGGGRGMASYTPPSNPPPATPAVYYPPPAP